jgi:hypothetical protein
MTSVVGASYQRNHGDDDQLFVIRSNNSPGQPSEILNYLVSSKQVTGDRLDRHRVCFTLCASLTLACGRTLRAQGVEMRFGHVTYLEGQSNTLFTNDNSTQLLWTQVVPDWQNTGSKRGVLFDYSLQAPRFFRNGNLDFGSSPYVRSARWCVTRVCKVSSNIKPLLGACTSHDGVRTHSAECPVWRRS